MKLIFFLALSICLPILAANLTVSVSKDEKAGKYAILTVDDDRSFVCERQVDGDRVLNDYVCTFHTRPAVSITPTQNDFFKITPFDAGDKFALKITAKMRSKIFSQNFNPKSDETQQAGLRASNRFIIVTYEKQQPFVAPTFAKGLNFPIAIKTDAFPFVKTLDVDGMPIHDEQSVADMKAYSSIQKMLSSGQYKAALAEIDRIEKSFPNSIFFSEYEFFRMKALSGMGDTLSYNKVVVIGKEWIRNHSSDEQLPDALLMMAVAYAKSQDFVNAGHYFARIIDDYEDSDISKRAMIEFAEAIRPTKPKDALPLYRRALFETKNVETASLAAFRMADLYLSMGDTRNATQYYAKIIKGNMAYVLKDKQKAFEFAKKLAASRIFAQAYEVGNALLATMPKNDENYETLLSLIGQWAHSAADMTVAKQSYMRYLSEFPSGQFVNTIQPKLDSINFGEDSGTPEQRLALYNEIIDKYPKDLSAQQALYKKLLLLFEQKQYDDVISLRDSLAKLPSEVAPKKSEILAQSLQQSLNAALAKTDCKKALRMLDTDKLSVPYSLDDKLFVCYEGSSRFTAAKEVAFRHKDEKELGVKAGWLYKIAKMSYRLGEYKNASGAAKDLLTLSRVLKTNAYDPIAYELFASSYELADTKGMSEAMSIIDSSFPKKPETIEPYKAMVRLGIKKDDVLLTLNYAKKLYELQQSIKVYSESPWIDFVYAEALNKNKEPKKALAIVQKLLSRQLSSNDKARALYLTATLQSGLKDKNGAKKTLAECMKVKDDSSWRKLCGESLELLK